jgi:14-3-3 protein epsilon
MADLWKPVKGVTIKEATHGKFLFHFAHPLDMEAVLNGGPWTFDNNRLLLEQVQIGMQIDNIPLVHTNLWVQIHNLPMGLMKESVGVKLANYIGSYVEYDKNNTSSFWRQYMRVRVKVDVRKPLKKDTKVMNKHGQWCTVNFKYEKLGVFCFVCGIMGHAENKCEVRFAMVQDDGRREWSADIRADPRRQGGKIGSKWLREERGSREENANGDSAAHVQTPTNQHSAGHSGDDVSQSHRHTSAGISSPSQTILMTRTNHSMPNQNARSTNSEPTNNNYSIPSMAFPNGMTGQSSSLISKTDTPPAFNVADNTFIPFPHINDFLASNNNQPVKTNGPVAETKTTQSLTHQTLTFTSQPTKTDPPKIIQKTKKHQPNASTSTLLIRPKQIPTRNSSNPDPTKNQNSPCSTRPRPNATRLQNWRQRRLWRFQGRKEKEGGGEGIIYSY